mmetsp:Transcript_47970/g.104273  ORF Transcript_47970/g.104273 Transcript_47970/m.104273 type:complete len:225 (-) Transcript_47970:70-744(-)
MDFLQDESVVLLPIRNVLGINTFSAVNVIALIHIVVNLSTLGAISSTEAVRVGTVLISAPIQIAIGLFVLAGFPCIVGGLAGSLYRIGVLLRGYLWYLALVFMMVMVYLVAFVKEGAFCTHNPMLREAEYRVTCVLTSIIMSSVLLLPLLVCVLVFYVVWSAMILCGTPAKLLDAVEEARKPKMPLPATPLMPALSETRRSYLLPGDEVKFAQGVSASFSYGGV